jgi:hypothetical protein
MSSLGPDATSPDRAKRFLDVAGKPVLRLNWCSKPEVEYLYSGGKQAKDTVKGGCGIGVHAPKPSQCLAALNTEYKTSQKRAHALLHQPSLFFAFAQMRFYFAAIVGNYLAGVGNYVWGGVCRRV